MRRLLILGATGSIGAQALDIVERSEGFLVVRKHSDVADVVEETDPRG